MIPLHLSGDASDSTRNWDSDGLETVGTQRITLVGHSFGGVVFEPDRLSHGTSPMEAPAFVVFGHDRTMPPGYWHPHMADRLAAPKIVELDGDHEAMLTAPDILAEA
jgi:hypothetical protein